MINDSGDGIGGDDDKENMKRVERGETGNKEEKKEK